jgi:NADPH:quinone reductase-like Zn-dependent oxidoreductase
MSLDMLATRGTLVLYGQSSGPVAPFDPGRLSGITGAGRGAGSLTLRWVAAGHYLTSQQERAAAVSAILDDVRAGRFSPRIAGRFPLRRASEAHASLASRTVLGEHGGPGVGRAERTALSGQGRATVAESARSRPGAGPAGYELAGATSPGS